MSYIKINDRRQVNLDGLRNVSIRKDMAGAIWMTLTFSFQDGREERLTSPTDGTDEELLRAFSELHRS